MREGTNLPAAGSEGEFDALDEAALRPGVERLFRELGLDAGPVERFATGSLPVYSAGDVVLKLFPPVYAEELPVEAGVLRAVHSRLPIPTPEVYGTGERDGWGYVLMSRMRGMSLRDAWDRIDQDGRDRLGDQLGQAIAVLHTTPAPVIDDWWPGDWAEFVAEQRAGCRGRQAGLGLAEEWLAQIPAALDVELEGSPPVLVHTEIMRGHLFVEQDPAGRWGFSGLIDFEPAMRGAAEYDFVGVGSFVAEGDRRFLGRVLRAYGYRDVDLDFAFRRRMMGWSLLHYYSNLPGWMKRLPEPAEPTFASLADRWFGVD